jgi:uncharacterized membrane protein
MSFMPPSLIIIAQTPVPHIDGMYLVMLLSRILHILGAIILIGGLFYIRFVLAPPTTSPDATAADRLFGGRRANWAKWVGIATALLLATGFLNYIRYTKTYELPSSYHMIIGIKMLAALVLFLLAALLAGRTSLAEKVRGNFRVWIAACLLIGIVTITLGSILRTYRPEPKGMETGAPVLVAPSNTTEP